MHDFIQLNRRFSQLTAKAYNTPNENADYEGELVPDYTFSNWDGLINEYRTVILAEAGAGKTHEIRNINEALEKAGDGPGINNCFQCTLNVTADGTVDSKPFQLPTSFETTLTATSTTFGFDRALGEEYSNFKNPQIGDAIRYSEDKGVSATHAAVYLLTNSKGTQVFTKNGVDNSALYQIMYESVMLSQYENYGTRSGRTNYSVTDPNTKQQTTTSDSSPFYRKK